MYMYIYLTSSNGVHLCPLLAYVSRKRTLSTAIHTVSFAQLRMANYAGSFFSPQMNWGTRTQFSKSLISKHTNETLQINTYLHKLFL